MTILDLCAYLGLAAVGPLETYLRPAYFKNGAFEGDYDYVPASDHGRWGLKKD